MGLLELVEAEVTDAKTDKGRHGYLPVYESLFEPLRETTLPVLEIGIGQGGSLKVWREFFPNSEIHGIDIRPTADLGPRIKTHQGHTLDVAFLFSVAQAGPFAAIIDDGGHVGTEQETAFRTLWPFVVPGGVYIIEDLHASYIPDYQPSVMPFLKSLADSVNQKGEFPDIYSMGFYPKMFVAQKGKRAKEE